MSFFFFLRQRCNNASIGLKCYFAEKSGRASGSLRLEIEMKTFRFVQIFFKFKTDKQSCVKIVLLKIDRLRLKFLEIDKLNTRVHGKKKKRIRKARTKLDNVVYYYYFFTLLIFSIIYNFIFTYEKYSFIVRDIYFIWI